MDNSLFTEILYYYFHNACPINLHDHICHIMAAQEAAEEQGIEFLTEEEAITIINKAIDEYVDNLRFPERELSEDEQIDDIPF